VDTFATSRNFLLTERGPNWRPNPSGAIGPPVSSRAKHPVCPHIPSTMCPFGHPVES